MDLKSVIRAIPDYPKPGILFRDITPVLQEPDAFDAALDGLAELISGCEWDALGAIESRGFLFGAPLADRLGKGLVIFRKPGKLPGDTVSESYALEYGEATLEVHRDAISSGMRILIIDDLLATGGTAAASGNLVRRLGGTVAGYAFLVSLKDLGGEKLLGDAPVFSLVNYGESL